LEKIGESTVMARGVGVLFALLLGACATPPAPPHSVPEAPGVPEPQAQAATAPAATAPAATAAAATAPAKPAAKPALAKAPAPAPTPAAQAVAPMLDLKALEQQLKATKAIGVLTKLSLKNQVDDLLEKFRSFYAGRLQPSLAELRGPFDMLLMKVLSLLQDGDPVLARSIHASREALWGILADRESFQKLA
jgi:hypothetical protein